jgi:O-antigen ligase
MPGVNAREGERSWVVPGLFGAAMAVAALAWYGRMRHPSYIRQVLLTALLAPAVLVGSLAMLGPTWPKLRAAVSGWPARVFLAGVWAHALLAWASLLWTTNAGATLDRSVTLTTLAMWGTGWLLAGASGEWKRLAGAHLAAGGLVAAVGTLSYLALMAVGRAPARLSVPIGNPNTVAVLMFFPIAGAVALLVHGARDARAWPWPGVGALGLAVTGVATFVFAWSRSGFVGITAGLLVLGLLLLLRLLDFLRRSRLWALVYVGVILVAVGCVAVQQLGTREKLAHWTARLKRGSVAARWYGSITAWRIFKEHPVGGAGAGTFLSEAPRRIPRERYTGTYGAAFLNVAHNEYAETGAELGVLGLLAFLAVLGGALLGAWRGALRLPDGVARALSGALAAGVAGVIISSLADPSFRYWDFTGLFYAAAGLAAAAGNAPAGDERAANPAQVGGGEGSGALPSGRLLPLLVGVVLCGTSTALWSYPDARREMSWLTAHWAARRARQLDAAALRIEKNRKDSLKAAELRARAGKEHALSAAHYRVAARTPGYFLSRVLSHYDWIRERTLCGRKEEALELAEELGEIMPECPQVLRYLSDARFRLGDRQGALADLVRAGWRDPYRRSFVRDFQLVFWKDAAKDRKLVEAVAGRLELGDAERATLESLADANRDDWTAAVEKVDGLTTAAVRFVPLELWRGLALLKAGRLAEAEAAVERHVKLNPLHGQGFRQLARVRAAAAKEVGSDGEIAALRRCLVLDVEHEEARLSLLRALVVRKRYEQALQVVLPYLPIARSKPRFILEAARIQQLLGRHHEAHRLLVEGLRRTGSPEIEKALKAMRGTRH